MKRAFRKLNMMVAIATAIALITVSLGGCRKKEKDIQNTSVSSSISTMELAEAIEEELNQSTSALKEKKDSNGLADNTSAAGRVKYIISDDWRDYIGDIDTFVYGLLLNEYQLAYKTFNAKITLPDETEIFGIGYTDYSAYYKRTDGRGGYFPAGFLALIGEPVIPENFVENGVEIINLDNEESEYQFVSAYDTEPYLEHCVIWGQYLCYGVGDNHHITYRTQKYNLEDCDKSLGSLYSFDEKRVIMEPGIGDYQYISGVSFYEPIDYINIKNEVDRTLEEQENRFVDIEVETTLYEAKDAMQSYLLSLQDETFMGCRVSELIAISETLDPKECVQVTPEGIVFVDMTSAPPKEPEALTKWITGICCGTALATCTAVSVFVPALTPVTSAVSGAAIEVFIQVVIQNQSVDNVNWGKVAVAASTSALLAWGCPLLAGNATEGLVKILGKTLSIETATTIGKISGYGILTFSNAVVTGSCSAAFSVLYGGTKEEAIDAFKLGAAIGSACTAASILVSNGASAGMRALQNTKPNSWFIKMSEKVSGIGEFVGKHQVHIFDENVENLLIPKSINEAAEAAGYQLKLQQTENEQLILRVDQLPSTLNKNFALTDENGNILTKADLRANGGNGILKVRENCDPTIKEHIGDVTEFAIIDGVPDLGPVSEYRMEIGLTSNRSENYAKVYDKLLEEWSEDPSRVPPVIQNELKRKGNSIYDINPSNLQDLLSEMQLTIHETSEGVEGTIYLVDRLIHSKISHAGGVAFASALEKISIGVKYFDNLHDSTVTSITGTLILEGAH